jgi:hypothetical protein
MSSLSLYTGPDIRTQTLEFMQTNFGKDGARTFRHRTYPIISLAAFAKTNCASRAKLSKSKGARYAGTKRPCTHHLPIQDVSSKGSLDEPTNAGLPARITSSTSCCNCGDQSPPGAAITSIALTDLRIVPVDGRPRLHQRSIACSQRSMKIETVSRAGRPL